MSELEYIEDYPIKKIKPYERNARKNDAAVPVLINAMQTLGNNDPIEVNEEGVILAGHTRYKALKEQGCKTARVIVVKGLTEEQQRAYRLEHNKTNEIAQWDEEILMEELSGIEDINMEDFGFVDDNVPIEGFGEDFVLPDGEKPDGCTMSFTLSSEQADIVRQALDLVDEGECADMGNTNKNGNKITGVCQQWLAQRT